MRFEYAGTRWTLVGFDRVPLWRPGYGHGHHENEPFRLIPEDTLPDWARRHPVRDEGG